MHCGDGAISVAASREAARRAAAKWAAAKRRAALVGRANTLSAELSKAAGHWQQAREEHGADFPAWSYGEAPPDIDKIAKNEDNNALEAVVDELAERVTKAQKAYAQQSALFKMRTSLQETSQVQAADSRAAVNSAQEEEAQREERERRRCAEEIAHLLETLEAEVSHDDRAAIENRVEETVESSASRRRALLAQLRLDIQRANAAGRARQQAVQQAEQWRERLLGFESLEVEELDSELRQIVDEQGPLPPNMAQRVEDVVARATEATEVCNREYALGVITEELESLGYVVEVGLAADSAEGSEMLLHKPGMEDDYHVSLYHVSLRAEAGAPLFHHRVVRESSDPSPDSDSPRSAARQQMDYQMELAWNQDLATVLVAAEHRGIHGRAVERSELGAVPVQTIAPLKRKSEPKSKPKRKPKSKPKRKRTGQLKSRGGR